MKLLKSMRNLLCGCSCTKDACAVSNDALSSVIGESPPIRPRASVRQQHRRKVVPLSQDIFHRSHLTIPEADEEENEKDEVPPLNKTKNRGKHLYPAVLLMLDSVKRAGAVNDRSSKSGDIMHKVYSPAPVMDNGVSDTIVDIMWRPHLSLIPEEEEIDSIDDSNNDKEDEDNNVNKEVLEDTVPGNVTGASDHQDAMKEVLAPMAESSETGDAMCNARVTAHVGPISIANVKWRPHLPLIPEEEEVDDFNGNGSGKEEEAENVNKVVLEGTVAGNVACGSDFEEAMNEVLALMAESSDSTDAMSKFYNPAPVTACRIPAAIANVIWRPQLLVIPEEEEAENVNKDVLEVTMAGNVAGVSDFQEAMNEVLALMTESSESVVTMHNVHEPSTVISRGVPAAITNFIWRPHLPPIPEEETV